MIVTSCLREAFEQLGSLHRVCGHRPFEELIGAAGRLVESAGGEMRVALRRLNLRMPNHFLNDVDGNARGDEHRSVIVPGAGCPTLAFCARVGFRGPVILRIFPLPKKPKPRESIGASKWVLYRRLHL